MHARSQFGLENAVLRVGDCFIELLMPITAGTTAAKYLQKNGQGGYMVILQVSRVNSLSP